MIYDFLVPHHIKQEIFLMEWTNVMFKWWLFFYIHSLSLKCHVQHIRSQNSAAKRFLSSWLQKSIYLHLLTELFHEDLSSIVTTNAVLDCIKINAISCQVAAHLRSLFYKLLCEELYIIGILVVKPSHLVNHMNHKCEETAMHFIL